jgi:hypothetical protein
MTCLAPQQCSQGAPWRERVPRLIGGYERGDRLADFFDNLGQRKFLQVLRVAVEFANAFG